MIHRLRMLPVLVIAAALASCSGGSSGGGTLPSTSSGPTPAPTAAPTATPTPTPAPIVPATVTQWAAGSAYAPSSITVSLPAAPASGDLLLVALWNNGQSTGADDTYTAPAGWTQVDQGLTSSYATYQVFSHVVTAGEANGYAFTPLSAERQHAWIVADAGNASGVDASANAFVKYGTAFTTPSVTPSHAGDLAITFNLPIAASGTVTWADPADWTLGIAASGPTWPGEALYQAQTSTAAVSETSTLSGPAPGFSAIVLLSPSGV